MYIRGYFILLTLLLAGPALQGQQVIPLYNGPAPDMLPAAQVQEKTRTDAVMGVLVTMVTRPALEIFLPEKNKATGTAVIICPGGGYGTLLMSREGRDVARAFNRLGVAAFVLKYRLPQPAAMRNPAMAPLQDAQQAIRLVRQHAVEWGVDTGKTGIMGFSAGGHLAATAGTHFNHQGIDLRPSFMLLINPVISFSDSIGHKGSRKNLLGPSPDAAQVRWFSNELQVTDKTPPAFLVHAGDDSVVPEENSLSFYRQLRAHGVPASLHIYQRGEHGFIKEPAFEEWFGRCVFWMKQAGWL